MRDPQRIEKLLFQLLEVWEKVPDWRLGQLIVNAMEPKEPCPEVFYIEDSKLSKKVARLSERIEQHQRSIAGGPPSENSITSTRQDGQAVQEALQKLFRVAAAMDLAMACRLDAEPEMAKFLEEVKAHPEQRPFVVKLFLDAFSDAFIMQHAPTNLLMYCMSDLRWAEIRDFVSQQREIDIAAHGVACYGIWGDILESFEDNWRGKYFTDFTK